MAERLTAMDIEKQEFPIRVRGYDRDDVQLFLKSVGEEIERLNLENGEQREQLGHLCRRIETFESREQTLQDAIVSAQRMSEEMVQRSRQEAELLVREARSKAERLLQQAQDQLARIENEIGRARLERDAFEKELRSMLEHHLELLDLRGRDRAARESESPHMMTMARSEAG